MRKKTMTEQFIEFLRFPEIAMMFSLAILSIIGMAIYLIFSLLLLWLK